MPKFIILVGSIKKTEAVQHGEKVVHIGKLHHAGEEIELSTEEAARINKKGAILEHADVHAAKKKAKDEAEKTVEAAQVKAKGGAK